MPGTGKNLSSFFSRLKADTDKVKLFAAVGLIVAALVYLDFALIIKAQLNSISAGADKVAQLSRDVNSLSQEINQAALSKARQLAQQKETVQRPKKILSEEEIPLLLDKISVLSNENNVRIMQLKPSREEKSKQPAQQAAAGPAFASAYFIKLDLLCGFHQCGSFINDLENAEEFLTIEDFKISRDADNYLEEEVSLTLKTYVKK